MMGVPHIELECHLWSLFSLGVAQTAKDTHFYNEQHPKARNTCLLAKVLVTFYKVKSSSRSIILLHTLEENLSVVTNCCASWHKNA